MYIRNKYYTYNNNIPISLLCNFKFNLKIKKYLDRIVLLNN